MTLLTFHSSQETKDKYLSRVRLHRKADHIIQGITWSNGKGCAVGCTLEYYNHDAYPNELGLPVWLAYLEDALFEGMSNSDAKLFPENLLDAIPIGVDVEQVKKPFLSCLLESTLDKFDHKLYPDVLKSVTTVIALLNNPEATEEEYKEARMHIWSYTPYSCVFASDDVSDNASANAAAYAAAYAADAADAADAAYASYDAAAANAATYAAQAAYVAAYIDVSMAAAYDAEAAAYKNLADKLLKLLKDCK